MAWARSLGRALLLIALLVIGIGIIWYIGRSLSPRKPGSVDPAPVVKAAPAVIAPDIPPLQPESQTVESVPPREKLPRMVMTARGELIATEPILFNSGASTLREASIPRLDRVAEFLIQNPDITVEIIGHTDNLGPEPVNRSVSAERAAIVLEYLVSQGIDPSRLRSGGMGSLDPIDSNETQLGRQANRRIEFLVRNRAAAIHE